MTIYYFISPNQQNEFSQRIHQLSNTLISLQKQSFIIYVPHSNTNIYPQYTNIQLSHLHNITDIKNNVVIMSEIYTEDRFRKECNVRWCRVVIWWQTFLNASFNYTLSNLSNEGVMHMFHSYYEYVMVYPHLSLNNKSYCFVNDYISIENHNEEKKSEKENCVCFEGGSDLITKRICEENNIKHYDLNGKTKLEQDEIFAKCKVYIDMSSHAGQRTLPRRACLYECIVITNKSGASAYWEEIPIEEKIGWMDSKIIVQEIQKIFERYEYYVSRQEYYRDMIRNERNEYDKNVQSFIRYIETPQHCNLQFVDENTFKFVIRSNKELFQTLCSSFESDSSSMNLYSIAMNATNILQIGFGDGTSIALFLLANTDTKVLCLDDDCEVYSKFKYLYENFGDRIELLLGNIQTAIYKFKELSDRKFDVVHYNKYTKDIMDMCESISTDYIIIDKDNVPNRQEIKMRPTTGQFIYRRM